MSITGSVTLNESDTDTSQVLLQFQQFILTNKFSQDHLELFFGAVGHEDNLNRFFSSDKLNFSYVFYPYCVN
jgi:hypothetical protein